MIRFSPISIILSWCLLSVQPVFSQVTLSTSTTNSGGNSFQNDAIQLEWSIGEMVAVNTTIESSLIVSKGVLQPQRVRPISAEGGVDLKLYPTLTSGNNFWISARIARPFTIQARVFTSTGQLISTLAIPASPFYPITSLTLPIYTRAVYLIELTLTLSDNTQIIKKTYRIQKV